MDVGQSAHVRRLMEYLDNFHDDLWHIENMAEIGGGYVEIRLSIIIPRTGMFGDTHGAAKRAKA